MARPDINYFELLGLDAQYDVDLTVLKKRYQELQQAVHPDKFATHSDSERLLAVQQSGYVNDAYHTLRSPILRAKYLLKLKGLDISSDMETIADSEFLMEQIELREALSEVAPGPEAYEKLEGIRVTVKQRMTELENVLRKSLGDSDINKYRVSAAIIKKLQFFTKLHEEVLDREAELE